MKTGGPSNPGAGAKTDKAEASRPRSELSGSPFELIGTVRSAQEGLACEDIWQRKPLPQSLSVAAFGAALSLGAGTAIAAGQDVTEDQIVRALAPQEAADPRPFGGPQRRRSGRSPPRGKFRSEVSRPVDPVTVERRTRGIATIAKDKPKIDLEINFDYNSADISAKSLPSVQALGKALTNADLKGSTFVVAGHTDAAGGEAYNQELFERRADAIKRYLTDKFGIDGTDLVTVGYGKSKLKDPDQPMAEVNRRVQVVNMETRPRRPSTVAIDCSKRCK